MLVITILVLILLDNYSGIPRLHIVDFKVLIFGFWIRFFQILGNEGGPFLNFNDNVRSGRPTSRTLGNERLLGGSTFCWVRTWHQFEEFL